MAIGGGTFIVQNKVLPGAYINFISQPRALGGLGERGTICLALPLNWGPSGMMTVESADFQTGAKAIFGYEYNSTELCPLRELFRYGKTVKVYRLNSGEKAKVKLGGLLATAKWGGERGNSLQVVISKNIDEEGSFDVKTFLDGEAVDTQTVKTAEELKPNEFVEFSGSGVLTPLAGTALTSGTNKEVTGTAYNDFLQAAEMENFQVLVYGGEDDLTKGLFEAFTKRMRNEEGVKFVTVLFDYKKADFEGIISVQNETVEDKAGLVYWVAGAEAGANVNESLTNRKYNGEFTVKAKYKKSRFISGMKEGEFFFYEDGGDVRVLSDINTFISFEPEKNDDFSSNRVIRVLDAIANDVAGIFSRYYLGKQGNHADGRNLLKTEMIRYHEQLQSIDAIEDFLAEDIIINQGTGKRDVVVFEKVKPTDAMEKLYMKVEVI